KWLVFTLAAFMNFLRNHFLTTTALTINDDAVIGRGYQVYLLEYILEGHAVTEDRLIRIYRLLGPYRLLNNVVVIGFCGCGNRRSIGRGRYFGFQGFANGYQDLIREQGLGNIIVRTKLHYFHGGLDIAVTGYDDHRDFRILFLDLDQQCLTIHVF